MNRRLLTLVVIALLLPLLVRVVWFFPGFSLPRSVATPDYANLKMPQAPLSTPIAAPVKAAAGTVLVDYAHSNQFQWSEVQSLTGALTQRGGRFVLSTGTDTLDADLRAASAYVVISPSDRFKPAELGLIRSFVARGGRLAIFTDATRGAVQYDFLGNPVANQPDVDIVDPLLAPFGITVNADYLYDLDNNEGNFRNVFMTSFGKSDLTAGIRKVAFYGTHSLCTESGSPLLIGSASTLSSSTDAIPDDLAQRGWAAAVLNKEGSVLAVGDFSFLASPYDGVADNQVFIAHIADFLLAGNKQPDLAAFPYIFRTGSVSLLGTSGIDVHAGMIDKVAALQGTFEKAGGQLKLVEQPPAQGDLIVLGTFSPADDLDPYLKAAGVAPKASGLGYRFPSPFSDMAQYGNGILVFHSGDKGNTLVLLTASNDDMTSLLDALATGDLSGCIIQGNVGACSVGFGGGLFEITPTPEAVPTAGG